MSWNPFGKPEAEPESKPETPTTEARAEEKFALPPGQLVLLLLTRCDELSLKVRRLEMRQHHIDAFVATAVEARKHRDIRLSADDIVDALVLIGKVGGS